jgi:GGDEF domain-containing protein
LWEEAGRTKFASTITAYANAPIIDVIFARFLVGVLLAAPCLAAAIPLVQIDSTHTVVNLAPRMAQDVLPLQGIPDPDGWWTLPVRPSPQPGDSHFEVDAGQRAVGRIVLRGGKELEQFVVLVPSARIDEVRVWFRYGGAGPWKDATAGDMVPLSKWSFVGPMPAFPVLLGELPGELIVTLVNDGGFSSPVMLLPDAEYRKVHVQQAVVSGFIGGLGIMVMVVCLISALSMARGASLLLSGVAAWALVFAFCLNGSMAMWITPEWPRLNDASKHASSVILSGLVLSMTAFALDARYFRRLSRVVAVAAPLAALAYAAIQIAWLPHDWRGLGALGWAALTSGTGLALCALSALAGGRFVLLVVAANLCYVLAVASAVFDPFEIVSELDLADAVTSVLVFASVLVFRYMLFIRERYGRDVLGRAAVGANRDPLTALLSYSGLQLAYDEAMLRQGSQSQRTWAIVFFLPGLERNSFEHGFVLTERALVRFAAALQSVLGDHWSIGRLSKTRFAAVSNRSMDAPAMKALATRVLAASARLADELGPSGDFDLRIVFTRCAPESNGLKGLVARLEEPARALDGNKRITLV